MFGETGPEVRGENVERLSRDLERAKGQLEAMRPRRGRPRKGGG